MYTSHMLPVVERSSSVAILDDVENIVYSIPNRRQSYTLRILVRARRNTGVGLLIIGLTGINRIHFVTV